MPFGEPQRDFDVAMVVSLKQQADYATVLADVDIDRVLPYNEIAVAQRELLIRTDGDKYGKGHEHPTAAGTVRTGRNLTRPFNMDASDISLALVLAFGMGKVGTAAGPPIVHTIDELDPAVTKQIAVTSMIEKLTAGVQRKLHSMACNDFTLSGANRQVLQVQSNWIGSGEDASNAKVIPAVSAQSFFEGGDTTVEWGPNAGGLADISDHLANAGWSVGHNNNLITNLGPYPSTGEFFGRLWIGKRRNNLTLNVLLDETTATWDVHNDQTVRYVRITSTIDANNILQIDLPSVQFLAPANPTFTDGVATLQLTTGENGVMRGGTPDVPLQFLLTSSIAALLATP